jgi:hypothetical protein
MKYNLIFDSNNLDIDDSISNIFKSKINNFLDYYNNLSVENTVSTLNSKNRKYYKYSKYSKDKKKRYIPSLPVVTLNKSVNAWLGSKSNTNLDKIHKLINSILNKLTKLNFDKLVSKLVVALNDTDSIDTFHILANIILDKCIYESEYHGIYVLLCNIISNNNTFYLNITTIHNIDDKYCWTLNGKDTIISDCKLFSTEEDVKDNIYNVINFIKIILKKCKEKFAIRHDSIIASKTDVTLTEDNIYKIRKKYFSNIEFMSELFNINLVDNIFICDIIEELLRTKSDNIGDEITEEDIEGFHKLWIILSKNNNYLDMINRLYMDHIKNTIMMLSLSKRIKFILEEIITKSNRNSIKSWNNSNLSNIIKQSKSTNKVIVSTNNIDMKSNRRKNKTINDSDLTIIKNIDNTIKDYLSHTNINEALSDVIELPARSRNIFCSKILSTYLDTSERNRNILNALIKELYIKKYISNFVLKTNINKVLDSIDDLKIDIPLVDKNLENFFNNLENNDWRNNNLKTILKLRKDENNTINRIYHNMNFNE